MDINSDSTIFPITKYFSQEGKLTQDNPRLFITNLLIHSSFGVVIRSGSYFNCLIFYHRNGIQQRRNSFEDGVYGTTCPIPPGGNFTYILQVKDQIGTYYYFPSLGFHKAAGGFGGIRVLSRPMIPVPFPPPAADYTLLIGDWFKANHTV
jgi:Multicopper oxidase